MSMRQVLLTTEALLKDETIGLRATVEAFAAAHPEITGNPGPLEADFNFVEWTLPGDAAPASRGNVMLAPAESEDSHDAGGVVQDGVARIEIGFEAFNVSTKDLQNQLTLVYVALRQILLGIGHVGIVDYARANGGTIYEIVLPIRFRFLVYPTPTVGGWLCTATLLERSTE